MAVRSASANALTRRARPAPLNAAGRMLDVGARSHHRWGWSLRIVGGDCGEETGIGLPGARTGRPRQFDLPFSATDGLFYDAGAPRNRRPAFRVTLRQAHPRRGAEVLPEGRRNLRF